MHLKVGLTLSISLFVVFASSFIPVPVTVLASLLLSSAFEIRILQPPVQTITIGQNLSFTCEMSPSTGLTNPLWRGPNGQPIQQGMDLFLKDPSLLLIW